MRTIQLTDTQRGLLVRAGRVAGWLEPGQHTLWRATTDVRVLDLTRLAEPWTPELARFVPEGVAESIVVPERAIALVRADGLPAKVLTPGRYLLWQQRAQVSAEIVSTAPTFATGVPDAFVPLVPVALMRTILVQPWERALLVIDGAAVRLLEPGRHLVWSEGRVVASLPVDLRERETQVIGQEVITADKVTIRINLVAKTKVVDAQLACAATVDLSAALYTEAQLAARRFVAGHTVDQLLERRDHARHAMREALAERARAWGVEVLELDLKDVVLPGEMKSILNQVIEAEKRAAANVVLRREETAATRSLANTAKLLEQSPTLLRLKELEAWKEIAERVGQVTIVASPHELASRIALPGAQR